MSRFVRPASWPAILTLAALFFVQTFAQPAAAAAAAPETVVFVGGLGSTPDSSAIGVGDLVAAAGGGHTWRTFIYGSSSCEPIAQATAELDAYLEQLRGQTDRVILVGHSNGGVLALDAVGAAPDLAPFVERVVTVDSPLEGISASDAFVYGARYGTCPAADDLYHRHTTAGWSDYLEQLATWERGLGVDVRIVVNTADVAVLPADQEIPNDSAYLLSATDPADWTNHRALLEAPAAAQLGAIIAGL